MKAVILKPGKEKAIRQRHHWIFSGAVQQYPEFADGDLLTVQSHNGDLLGTGYFNRQSSIVGRIVCFGDTPPLEAIRHHLDQAIALRHQWFSKEETNAYRLVNGEGDLLPGLIIDQYADVLVLQISTLGMEKLREWLVQYLIEKIKPQAIYEKSIMAVRQEEGLSPFEKWHYGTPLDEVVIRENGLQFIVPITTGQKTGFFLDHREMRQKVRTIARGKRVLNCFSYTAAFSIYALAGGAVHVDSVDISSPAIEIAKKTAALNGYSENKVEFHVMDVFQFLREHPLDYDLIILDPPAFAKRKKDINQACRGYKDINRLAMQRCPEGALLLTSSCSYYVDDALFQMVLFQAAVEAKRTVRILGHHQLAADHPLNICHPEGNYLKSRLLHIL